MKTKTILNIFFTLGALLTVVSSLWWAWFIIL